MARDFPPLHLLKSPLVYVLAQAVFSPVLRMDRFVPEIQERMRRSGYVGFIQDQRQQLVFTPEPSIQPFTRWIFSNRENTQAVVLSQNFVVLETSRYDRFETFVEDLWVAFSTIAKVAEPALVERLGLRYIDVIAPGPGESFSDYLRPALLGLSAEELGAANLATQYEATGSTDAGQLVLRLSQPVDETLLPADLFSSQLRFSTPSLKPGTYTILDVDNFVTGQFDFVAEPLLDRFWQLHRYADRAFRNSVTEKALQIWQAQPVPTTA
ncbi:TIGR04255 family protein [Gloeobacter morelensis]|uniref:TIGR04255 family protein n=1 Tax=Gloeobacter morelensis MG652769 TaxID=2781736 RepID=A0ABY3PMG1_9CYAN|nr:TIGR04255 family protein [Gloeobacter morelensis]UFP94873.1 TIGR04255 family protein [Gloeobacter morelensis MG652769]